MGKRKSMDELLEGRHFDREVIILCVRRYLRSKPGLRDLVEIMAERGLSMAHTTIMKGQFVLPANVKDTGTPAAWNAVLSAC